LEGTFVVTLEVEDDEGLMDTDVAVIQIDYTAPPNVTVESYGNTTVVNNVRGNTPPTLTASFIVTNEDNREVSLSGSGSDSDGTIDKYEWDFDGDGQFDYSSNSTGDTTYSYNSDGIFVAVFKVTDNNGSSSMTVLKIEFGMEDIIDGAQTETGAAMDPMLLIIIIVILVIVAIGAALGGAKAFTKTSMDAAAEQEVSELKTLLDESKKTGVKIDEADQILRELENK
jgi:hypothetical protein